VGAGALAAVALLAKTLAESRLSGDGVDLGVLQLRLAYNTGVAFSVGAGQPSWRVVALTAAITTVLAVYAWRYAAGAGRAHRLGGAAVLGGALANLADRAGDGAVTDYLNLGWWPTFNLADTFIIGGVSLLALTACRQGPQPATGQGADSGTTGVA